MVDNFDIIKTHLVFPTELDRYVIHILRRPKDCHELKNKLGSNEAQRLIKSYYVHNIEYFETKIPAIKELCESCNARAYLIVSPKDNRECLINLGKKIFDIIQNNNYSIKPEHLIRQAYCETHKSRKKTWILDLDNDQMYGWKLEDILQVVKKYVLACGHDVNEIYIVNTRNGLHIITPPFNVSEAVKECPMIYEGVKDKKVGWLHKDGMTLLYCK